MKKKAQLNQVFIMIFALLIIGTVAVLGVRSVGGLLDDKCTVDMVTFKDKITGTIANRNDFGAVHEERISSPCGFAQICLVDRRLIAYAKEHPRNIDPTFIAAYESASHINFIIDDSVRDGVENNVFLLDEGYTVAVGYAEELQVLEPSGVYCQNARSGTFNFKMAGVGRYTEISDVTP